MAGIKLEAGSLRRKRNGILCHNEQLFAATERFGVGVEEGVACFEVGEFGKSGVLKRWYLFRRE